MTIRPPIAAASDVGQADATGLNPRGVVHRNLSPAILYEYAIRREEGEVVAGGPFNAITAPHTGRSPGDKFVVREPTSAADLWWGKINTPLTPEHFEQLRNDVRDYLNRRDELFVRDVFAGADPAHRIRVRFVTTNAWHTLFVYNMFIRPKAADDGDPHREMDRAFIVSVVRQALRDTQRICSEKGLDDHMQIFVRHYYDGQPYQSIASDFGVAPPRAAVMARSAARNFKAALRDLLSCDGAESGEIDGEIESLLETASDE